jgi:hypothetical protein
MNTVKVTTERPKWNDVMTNELAQIMGEIVFNWCNGATDLDTCIEDCEDVLKWNRNEDGYKLAKELEDKGYESDARLVDELDYISHEASNIQKKHISKWVRDNDLKLDIPIDADVKFRQHGVGVVIGKVVKHYPETIQYGVRAPGQSETSHYIMNPEDFLIPNS